MNRVTRIELLIACAIACFLAFCLASVGRCDDITDAKKRLQEIERAKPAPHVIDPAPLTPVPDPISDRRSPAIEFQAANSDVQISERLPRAVLVCGQYCSPCLRMEKELEGLVGGPSMPIQVVSNWLANDLDKWGIAPSMQLGTPYLFILDKEGKVHALTPAGLGCVLRGYQTKDTVLQYLAKPEHGVDINTQPAPMQSMTADVHDATATPETFAAVLAAHLAETSGQQAADPVLDGLGPSQVYGSLFDLTIDAPDTWRLMAAKLLTAQRITFESAGITLDWTGPKRTFVIGGGRSQTEPQQMQISPPVKVTLNKWMIRYSCSLDGVSYTPDLTRMTMLLSGAPDLTVNLR
jgi:hypothetical protein